MDPLNSEHRSRIEQDFTVRKLNSAITLDHLLFKYDKTNGMRHALKVEKNTELAHKIIEIKELPEVRVVAAEYLAEIGETKLAEETCLEIMWQPYRCIGINRDEQSIETDNDKYDQRLYFARHRAMPFMLSKLKSERCFRVVYDRANMDWTDGQEKWKLPHGWKGISRYDTGGLEIDEAKAIISGLTGEDTCE
jgi:hypothetical protein